MDPLSDLELQKEYEAESNYKKLIAKKPLETYPADVLGNIKLLSINKNKLAEPFGSYTYRIQKYAGDIDLIEGFEACCTVEDVVHEFSKKIQRIVSEIIKVRLHYISEVKLGIDKRFDVNIGKILLGKFYINTNLNREIKKLSKLLSSDEIKILKEIIEKKNHTPNDYDIIFNIFREKRILRWTDKEIIKGKKMLIGNKSISLKEALTHDTPVKIDMITNINGKFMEITNFIILAVQEVDGTYTYINFDADDRPEEFHKKINEQLRIEIEKLFFSEYYYNPFKMIKRMWALSRATRDSRMLYTLAPFISGDTSQLYQIKSNLESISNIYKKTNKNPKMFILNELEGMKQSLLTNLELNEEQLIILSEYINRFENLKKHQKIFLLGKLQDFLFDIIDVNTLTFMFNVRMFVPPIRYLPTPLRYVSLNEYYAHYDASEEEYYDEEDFSRSLRGFGVILGGKENRWTKFLHSKKGKNLTISQISDLYKKEKKRKANVPQIIKQVERERTVPKLEISSLEQEYEDSDEREFLKKLKKKLYDKLFNEMFNPQSNKMQMINQDIRQSVEEGIQEALRSLPRSEAIDIPQLQKQPPFIPPPPPLISPPPPSPPQKKLTLKIPKKGSIPIPPKKAPNIREQVAQEAAKKALERIERQKSISGEGNNKRMPKYLADMFKNGRMKK